MNSTNFGKCLTCIPLSVYKDVFADALLCFGANSASMDEDSACVNTDEVGCCQINYNWSFLSSFPSGFLSDSFALCNWKPMLFNYLMIEKITVILYLYVIMEKVFAVENWN